MQTCGGFRACLAFAAWLATIGGATAQQYPARPITMVAPFPAGAPVDAVGRIIAERMRVSLGQAIIVENISGGGGSIGVARAARAAPDGYTVSLGNFSSHVLAAAIQTVQYDALDDFEPVVLLASNPQLIVSRTTISATDLNSLIAWLKANGGKASAGTAGVGSVSHVAGAFFQKETGTQFQFVPYRGVNLAQQDLIGGQIDLLFDQAINALANVRAGKIRAYAVTAKARLDSARDIPTVDEAGLPGLHMSVWNAIWVPKRTPKDIIVKLNAAAVEALADPAIRHHLTERGLNISPRERQTPEALGAFHKAEIDKWWPIIKAANIRAE
jgi:tripartite-type tricarboxylate transporter receptor subunit TctC